MRISRLALATAGLLGLAHAVNPQVQQFQSVLVISEFDSSVENTYLRSRPDLFNVTGVTKANFQAMGVNDFGDYTAIVIADSGNCDRNEISFLSSSIMTTLKTVATGIHIFTGTSLSREVAARLAISPPMNTTDVTTLFQGGLLTLTRARALSLYISFGCYYQSELTSETVPALDPWGLFTMRSPTGTPPDCTSNVSFAQSGNGNGAMAFPGSTEADLQAWICAASSVFVAYPRGNPYYTRLIEANTMYDRDGQLGTPYVLGLGPIAPACGNGRVDKAFGEQCDTGGVTDPICRANCTCVYGLNTDTNTCLSSNGCGNFYTERGLGEECDEGPTGNSVCSSNCTCIYGVSSSGYCNSPPFCGNGIVEAGEQCEPKMHLPPRSVEGRGYDPPVSDGICNAQCQCIYGLSATPGVCNNPPNNSTTTSSTTTTNTLTATSLPVTTTSGMTSSLPGSSSASSSFSTVVTGTSSNTLLPSPTSSPASSSSSLPTQNSLPARVNDFVLKGCTSSSQNYPSFSLLFSSEQMDLEMCIAGCAGRTYAGIHIRDCYCSDQYAAVQQVPSDLCNVPCPGNALENCGGYRLNSTFSALQRRSSSTYGGVKRRQAGPGSVPANALLAIYEFSPLSSSAAPTGAPATSSSSPVVPGTTAAPDQVTSTGTVVVTATAVVTVGPNTNAVCATGFCHAAGYVFELCHGGPRPGELVFVREACSCAGGWRYAPAGCDGAACGSLVVYRAVAYTGAQSGTVYQPQACASCSGGGVVFQQGGSTTASIVTSTGTANGTAKVVVVAAGASRLAGYLSSAVVAAGALLLLL